MTGGRTVWWAKDSAWWRREAIVELGEEFGPAGPGVVDWLACEAKAQNDGGWVKAGYRTLARGTFGDMSTVVPIVSRAVRLGLLDDFEEGDRTFTCRISGWADEQQRARETTKKAQQRAAAKPANDAVEPNQHEGHGDAVAGRPPVSPSVPECPPTGQDRTEEKEQEEDARATTPAGLHDDLDAVLAILRAAPDLAVEPLAVNSALMSRKGDAIGAAQTVASWAHEGGLTHKSANRLLQAALRHQADEAARQDGVRTAATSRESSRPSGRRGGRNGGYTAADYLAAGESA